jgi:CubicO group peptidase (beta-lactamase class C family)
MKSSDTLFTALLIALSFLFTRVSAQDKFTKAQKIIEQIHQDNPQVSISIGIVLHGDEHFFNYGRTSRDTNTAKVTEQSVYEIASVTKAITGLLVAQAMVEGKLSTEDFIDGYLPKGYHLKKKLQKRIKIKDLASHQSGLTDIDFPTLIEQNPQQPTKAITPESIVKMINETDSLKDYAKYRYSTIGFVLLGQILEEIYGTSYEKILNDKILKPLQMNSTYTSNFDNAALVQGYNDEGGEQEVFFWNCVAPAGLIKSSTIDMTKYLKAVLTNNDFAAAVKLQSQVFYADGARQIGLGVNSIAIEENTLTAKTGDTMGQSSVLAYDLENGWGIMIFVNQRNGKIRGQLFNELYDVLSK